MIIKRNYPKIQEYMRESVSMMIFGPRGSGKTFYLERLIKDIPNLHHVNLLNQESFDRYLLHPSLLFDEIQAFVSKISKHESSSVLVFVDEIQLLPKLMNEAHRAIEKFQDKCVFILTGSSARKLKREEANLLAGRALKCNFFPIYHRELDFNENINEILKWGSLPKTLTTKNENLRRGYLETYVHTYLREEIQRESEVRNLEGFRRFIELAAVYNGRTINYTKIGNAAGIDGKTVKEYFSILEDTLIAISVPAWAHSLKKQLQRSPKYYLFDNGVLNALTGELRSELRKSTYSYGRLFENLAVNEVYRCQVLEFPELTLYHYRTSSGQEIDLILQKNPFCEPVAVEIKSEGSPQVKDVKPLASFLKDYPKARCFVLCQTKIEYRQEGISFLPFSKGINSVLQAALDAPGTPKGL